MKSTWEPVVAALRHTATVPGGALALGTVRHGGFGLLAAIWHNE